MACLQEGLNVCTVPCVESRTHLGRRTTILKECVKFYAYLFGVDVLLR